MTVQTYCTEYGRLSRRDFLTHTVSSAAFLLGPKLAAMPAWMPRITLADPHVGPRGDTLVVIFLRGGADGLNIVVPHGDDNYYRSRPNIGIPRPDDNHNKNGRTLDMDGFFGLHPALAALHPIYQAGDLAAIHATGSPDETRSHFEAMDLMERGATANGDYTGWLARHLATLDTGNNSALRAIGVGDMLPAMLTGAVSATALQSIGEYHLLDANGQAAEMQQLLQQLYAGQDDLLAVAAQQTFAAMDVLAKVDRRAGNGRVYPETEFAQAMKIAADLILADVGMETACIDFGGWDTHVAQGSASGLMARLLAELGEGMAAFHEDLQGKQDSVTVVVMSEFGRRVTENGGLGTDHGHGNMMLAMGKGINGGRVFARWPGLHKEQLDGPGDLAITTDYRDVLGEILQHRLNNPRVSDIFPGYVLNELGLARPRL
ncbi:MAG: DUF1501 domain-containing protein [Candidatus Promineifilaceae bacterium]